MCPLSFPFHPQVFLYLSLLSPVWLFNPPECMEDSFDIRRKDRLLRRGPVSSQPMGITGLRQPFLCCWHFFLLTPHSLPILFLLCSPPLSRVEMLPFLRSCTKHQTRTTKAFAFWTKKEEDERIENKPQQTCCVSRLSLQYLLQEAASNSSGSSVEVITVSVWQCLPPVHQAWIYSNVR